MQTVSTKRTSPAAGSLAVPLFWGSLVVLAVLGAGLIFTATRLGAGLSDDSYYYIQPAREALAGRGLVLSPYFPPLLPALLAGLGLLGIDPLDGARYLNIFLFGLNIFLSGVILKDLTRSRVFGLLGALLVLGSEVLITEHAWALSEPLYLSLLLGSLVLLCRYFERRSLPWLPASALLAGLAAFTRYAGITLVATGVIYLLLSASRGGRVEMRLAIRPAFLYGWIGSLPLAMYLARNWLVTGAPFGPRLVGWQAFTQDKLSSALYNILTWFIPGRFVRGREILLALGLLAVLATGSAWLALSRNAKMRQLRRDLSTSPLLGVTALLVGLNFALLMGSRFVFGKGDAFNARYLAPVYLLVLFITCALLARFWVNGGGLLRAAAGGVFGVLLLTSAYRAWDTVQHLAENGAGFASARWHISETVAYLNKNPDVPVVATGEVGIYFWTDRLPRSAASFESMQALHTYLDQTGAYLVIIDSMPPELYNLDPDALVEGLEVVYDFSEGTIYRAPP